ncbi:hypothetical protein BJ742DRAFT_799379 [Cladochytrium replicatum]|nr:hypothetical protein BJ742DRAFT_799379 [Cladochytrium replicatum]
MNGTVTSQSVIDIIYRADGDGKGAFWDHYTIQIATGCPTRALFIPLSLVDNTENSARKFEEYLRNQTFNLPHSEHSHNLSKTCPLFVHVPFDDHKALKRTICQRDGGLLVIPGSDAKIWTKDHASIVSRAKRVLPLCQTIGRPVLAICAGTIALGESVGWETESVEGHASARMMTLNSMGSVAHNSQMHRLSFESGTILSALDQLSRCGTTVTERIRSNSVHNVALIGTPPAGWTVSAKSVEPLLTNRHKTEPEEDVTEAIEAIFGVPMIGTQFHPEAYSKTKGKRKTTTESELDCAFHRSIIDYMAQCGNARLMKQFITTDLLREQLRTLRKAKNGSTNIMLASVPHEVTLSKADRNQSLPSPPPSPE